MAVVKLRRSATAGVIPTSGTAATGQLQVHEIGMNTADKTLYVNMNGVIVGYKAQVSNQSVAAQALTAATRTYLVGSGLTLPSAGLVVGSQFEWVITLTKTAAGVAASTFDIAIGTLGTTGDAARVSFTKPAGTAVADEGRVTIGCIIRSIGASGVAVGNFFLAHNLAATGHALVPNVVLTTVSAAFDTTTATKIGICATTGAADACTVQMVTAKALSI